MIRSSARSLRVVLPVLGVLLLDRSATGGPKAGGAVSPGAVVIKGVAGDFEARGEIVGRESTGRAPEIRSSFVAPAGRATVEIPLRLPKQGLWWFTVEGPGLYSKPKKFVFPGSPSPVSLEVRPLVRVHGRVVSQPAGRIEGREAMVLWRRPGSMDPWESSKAAVSGSRLEAEIPAGQWDLAVKVTGCASDRRQNVSLPAGAAKDLGAISIVAGASFVGRIEITDAEASRSLSGARVTLSPAGERPQKAAKGGEISLSRETRPSSLGEFQFSGLPGGRYDLRVYAQGFAREDRSVDLVPDMESELRIPIALARPARLEIDLSPPLDPRALAWEIELRESGDAGWLPGSVRKSRSANGFASFKDVRLGGEYVAFVRAASGDVFRVESVKVDSPRTQLSLQMDSTVVVGKLTLGDGPLSAAIVFGGRNAAPSVSTKSGEDGDFRIELPRHGRWNVEILSRTPKVSRIVSIDVPEMRNGVPSRVELALPLTRLKVHVRDAKGAPAAGCLVRLESIATHETLTESAGEGESELVGLADGEWIVFAESVKAVSDRKTVSVEKNGNREVTLTLAGKTIVRGVVVTSLGVPVPYARLQPLRWDSRADTFPPIVVADAIGRFELQVPSSVPRIGFLVFPPGRTMTTALVPVGGSDETVVEVPEERGGVRLSFDAVVYPFPRMPWITDGTLTFPAILLRASSEARVETREGRTWVELPSYRAGPFGLCASAQLGTSDVEAAGIGCILGSVQPGRELLLELESPRR